MALKQKDVQFLKGFVTLQTVLNLIEKFIPSSTVGKIEELLNNQQISRIFQGIVENATTYTLTLKAPVAGKITKAAFKSTSSTPGTFTIFDDGVAIEGLQDISTATDEVELEYEFAKDSEITIVFTGSIELFFEIFINYEVQNIV